MKVLIVGAGLAGLAAALALASESEDVEVIIVERRPDFESRGATFGLAKNGQAALKEFAPEICDRLTEAGLLMPTGGYMLPWWVVRDALLEEVRARGDRIALHLGVSIRGVTESEIGGPAVATFEDSEMTIEADAVVGADGVHSHVRRNVLRLPPANPTNACVWRGSVDTNSAEPLRRFKDYPFETTVLFGNFLALAYSNFQPKVDGKLAWVAILRTGGDFRLPGLSLEPGTTTPLDVIECYVKSVDAPDEDLLQKLEVARLVLGNTHHQSDLTFSTEMGVVDLDRDRGWGGEGRVTLIGDAAHALRPVNGLGGSLAFEDAALLSRALLGEGDGGDGGKECGKNGGVERRLRRFEARRLPRCRSISRDQSIRADLYYKVKDYSVVPGWDPRYEEWVMAGPEASPVPPVSELDVFGKLVELVT